MVLYLNHQDIFGSHFDQRRKTIGCSMWCNGVNCTYAAVKVDGFCYVRTLTLMCSKCVVVVVYSILRDELKVIILME